MRASWIRFAIAVVVVVAVVGLAALEMIAARTQTDTVVAGLTRSGQGQHLRVDVAWHQDSTRQ